MVNPSFTRVARRIIPVLLFLLFIPWCSAQTPDDMATAHRWTSAKFLGEVTPNPPASYLQVYMQSGDLGRNKVAGSPLRIVDQEFSRGLHFPSDGKVRVVLSAPARSFDAVVGVDSNERDDSFGVGRGAVLASVEVAGKTPFRSEILHEGMAGVPVKVDLAGATTFDLDVQDGGGGRSYHQYLDQADWADARITMADGKTVWLENLPVGPPPAPLDPEPPFSFRYAGESSSYLLKMWEPNRRSRRIDDHRTEHTLTYTDRQTGLVLRAVGVEYRDFPVVEWTLYFKNTGIIPSPILENIQALDTRLDRGQAGEFILHHNKGSQTTPTDFEPYADRLDRRAEKHISAGGGRPTNTDMCYFNVALPGEGTIVAVGWPGQWAASFKRDEGTGLAVRVGQELTHFRLLPGEEVRSPLVALLFWHGDWIDGQNVWRRWMVADNLPRTDGKLPAPLMSSGSNGFTILMQGATEQNQKESMQWYLDRGWKFDCWWMDAGWYHLGWGWSNTGTWDPDPERFPHGIRTVSDFAHAHRLKTIVWFEPERVTHNTWLSDTHPEWLLGPKDARDRLLDLGNPEAFKWVTEHFDRFLTEQGIDVYRQDMNFDPLDYWRANDAPDRQGMTEIRHVTAYLAFWDEMLRTHPGLMIDTCAGGGRRDDLETLRRSVPLWRSDYAYDQPAAMQDLSYGLAMWVPYFGTTVQPFNSYSFRSTMTLAPSMGADPRSRTLDFKALEQLASEWRQVSPYYYGDYYPLTRYSTEDDVWMAWQYHRPDSGDGMVQVFRRAGSPIEKVRFKLRGLDPAAQYSVRNLDEPGDVRVTGRELAEKGLAVEIKTQAAAVIMVYKKVGLQSKHAD